MIDEKKLIEILSKNSIFEKITNAEGKNIFEIIDDMPKTDCSECSRRKFYQQGYQDGLNADKWIPCEERLPRRNEDVLVYRPKMAMPFLVDRYEGYYGEDDNEWYEGWAYSINCEVTAWQPLPQPYQEDKQCK